MIRDNREYRQMPIFKRASDDEGNYIVEGYASTFDEYLLFEDEYSDEKFYERFEPTAFDQTDMSDVVFLLDHEGRVYARTRNGSVEVGPDAKGLFCSVDLSRSSSAKGVFEDIQCGNYDRMSFAFIVKEAEIIHDREARAYHRVIKSVGKLFDISAVSFPANPNTAIGVSARSAFDGFIEAEKQLDLAKAEEQRKLADAKAKYFNLEV